MTRPTERIPRFMKKLEEVWLKEPDQRFAQLIWNIFHEELSSRCCPDFYYMEEDASEKRIDKFRDESRDSIY